VLLLSLHTNWPNNPTPNCKRNCKNVNHQFDVSFVCMARSKKVDSESEPTERSASNRLVINLTPDNEVDWDALRGSQKQDLLNLVNNDVTILEHIGMSHDSVGDTETGEGEGAPDISLANVKAFLEGLTKTNAMALTMVVPMFMPHPIKSRMAGRKVPFKIDKDLALQCFTLTKEQHDELDPRAQRLAKKYLPAAARKHLDIWMLGSMYLAYMVENTQTLIQKQLQRDIAAIAQVQSVAPPQKPIDSDAANGHAKQESPSQEPGSTIESLEPGAEPPPIV
jgi:hypothetical protein